MRRQFKIVPLFVILLACASLELWQAGGRSNASAQQSFVPAAPASRPHASVTIRVADGSFVIKNLKLKRAGSSTILEGEVSNKTSRRVNQATFEIRAYDHAGTLLRGIEGKTIFTVQRLKAKASAPLNSGYGVWLQGISLEAIARLEIIEAGGEATGSSMVSSIPFAGDAADWKKYSETEE